MKLYDDSITKKDLEQIIELLQELLDKMEYDEVSEIKLKCNTYNMKSDFIAFYGKGYLPIYPYVIDDLDVIYKDEEEGD